MSLCCCGERSVAWQRGLALRRCVTGRGKELPATHSHSHTTFFGCSGAPAVANIGANCSLTTSPPRPPSADCRYRTTDTYPPSLPCLPCLAVPARRCNLPSRYYLTFPAAANHVSSSSSLTTPRCNSMAELSQHACQRAGFLNLSFYQHLSL